MVHDQIVARREFMEEVFEFLKHVVDLADGLTLDLSCFSSREAALGPVGPVYSLSGLMVATDGSLNKMGPWVQHTSQ